MLQNRFGRALHLPVIRRAGLETLPFDPTNQPVPDLAVKTTDRVARTGPVEASPVQPAVAEPYPGTVPDEQFEA